MKVLHFVRKDSHLRASFISNQIIGHNDYNPCVIFYEKRELKTGCGFSSGISDDIPVYHLAENENSYERLLFRVFKILSRRKKMRLCELINQIGPDVIHLHYGTDAGIYLKALSRLRIPSIVSFYGYDAFSFPQKYFGYGGFYLRREVFRNSDIVLAMSAEMREDLLKAGCPSEKIIIHYHGVPGILKTIQHNYYAKKESCQLTMLSFLDPVKGHIFVLHALSLLLKKSNFIFHLNIFGNGHFEPEIRESVKELDLENHVTFKGRVEYLSEEYFSVFQSTDIFLHPSVMTKDDKEGIPGALVEAMFAGLPVIATYHGGIPYVIEDQKTGVLVKEWDVEALAKNINCLANSPELCEKIGKAAREYAANTLDLSIKEYELEVIYNQAIKLKCVE